MQKAKIKIKYFLSFTFYFSLLIFHLSFSHAEIVDRIVATINNDVITLSELRERSRLRPEGFGELSRTAQPEGLENRDEREVLEGMINRILLLSEAKRLGLEGADEDDKIMIERFIDRRIKAFILIPMERARDFYEKNKDRFGGKDFLEVKDEINLYLLEEETNLRLERYLKELREKADIRIFLPY